MFRLALTIVAMLLFSETCFAEPPQTTPEVKPSSPAAAIPIIEAERIKITLPRKFSSTDVKIISIPTKMGRRIRLTITYGNNSGQANHDPAAERGFNQYPIHDH